ncbi:MAG TPA: glycosyltransferase family 9 protein [Candidatus Binatia bacterium]|nr:glycosyltransferase family 9 protein [Candidatus Binatia bacterium]
MSTKSSECRRRSRICAIFPGALGDFICFLPALQALARTGAVDLFARSEFAELTPESVQVQSIESSFIGRCFRTEPVESDDDARRFRAYDAVYSWFASANQDFRRRFQALAGGKVRFFPFRPAQGANHQADYYLDCVEQRADDSFLPLVTIRPDALRWCESFWFENSLAQRGVLTIAPGSGAREKNWSALFFGAVAQWWRETVGGAVVALIGPVERERGGLDPLRSDCIVADGLSLSQAAALLSRCNLYLGNDSGISHLAAATGTRTVTLFGPSNPRQWAPRGKNAVVLRRHLACSPCAEPVMKSCPHHACLTEFFPDEIIATLARLPEVITLTR